MQHVFKREEITVTAEETREVEAKYSHKCDFCTRRFKTRRDMLIHRVNCQHNYDTTDEVYEVEDITAVFDYKDARWHNVKRKGCALE